MTLKQYKRVQGATSYPTDGFDVVLGELEGIASRDPGIKDEGVISVEVSKRQPANINGDYFSAQADTISANTVTLKCWDIDIAGSSISEVTDGTDLSDTYFGVEVKGH